MLLHPPYTLWHLSYVAIGATIAPRFDGGRLVATLVAFFLAVGVCAHALDELHGRPLRTAIPGWLLVAAAAASLAGAVALGIVGMARVGPGLAVFIVVGVALTVGYNLELLGGRLHNDVTFAAAWGAFPVLTAYYAQAETLRLPALRSGRRRLLAVDRAAVAQHPGSHAAPPSGVGRRHRHLRRRPHRIAVHLRTLLAPLEARPQGDGVGGRRARRRPRRLPDHPGPVTTRGGRPVDAHQQAVPQDGTARTGGRRWSRNHPVASAATVSRLPGSSNRCVAPGTIDELGSRTAAGLGA